MPKIRKRKRPDVRGFIEEEKKETSNEETTSEALNKKKKFLSKNFLNKWKDSIENPQLTDDSRFQEKEAE